MKGFFLICSMALIFLLVEDLPKALAEEMTCKQVVSGISKRMMDAIASCTKEFKFKNGKEKQAKQSCVIKCAAIKLKMLTPEGRFPVELMNAFIEKECPPHLAHMKAKTRELYGHCQQTTTANLDPDEEFCKSYEPLGKCCMVATGKLCDA